MSYEPKNPVYSHCPLCDRFLKQHHPQAIGFEVASCWVCDYTHQGLGNYASEAIINGKNFYLEDYSSGYKKMCKKIEELRRNETI